MPDIASLVEALGGMAQKQQLVARGARDLDLTRAVRSGTVVRARQGWYTTLPENDLRVWAVRVGGRLTGISAVIAAGGWVQSRHPLHVSVHENAARLRRPDNRYVRLASGRVPGLVLHWDEAAVARRGTATSVDLRDALVQVVLGESFETAVAALDWALNTGAIDRVDLAEIMRLLPRNRRAIAGWVDERCESLPESLARTRLRLRGHSVEIQVLLGDFQRIDLVVDDCVGLETDGREFHLDRFEQDREKDLDITMADLHPLRPSANMVFRRWDRIVTAIDAAIAARSPRRSGGNSGLAVAAARTAPVFPRRSAWRAASSPDFPKRGTRGPGRAATAAAKPRPRE